MKHDDKDTMTDLSKGALMNNKLVLPAIVALLIIGCGAFYGGTVYQKSKDSLSGATPQQVQQRLQSLGLNPGARGGSGGGFFTRTGGTGRTAGGVATGQVLSKDDKSITIKMQDGSTKVIYYSGSTTVNTTAKGSINDVDSGKNVTVNGSPNSDGSITAQTIQVRPTQ